MFNKKNKQIALLQQKNDELIVENNSFEFDKIYDAGDYDLIVLLKYFKFTSKISLAIQNEYYQRSELHKQGIDTGEERNIFGTLYQNQEMIVKLLKENERLRQGVWNYKSEIWPKEFSEMVIKK